MSLTHKIAFTLNGGPVTVEVPATMSALDMLREQLDLTGTKYGCGEGECGACTILADGVSLNSCLMFAIDCDGRDITTVEGLAHDETGAAIQAAFVENGGVQCGFCTPGLVVQAKHLIDRKPHASRDEIKRGIEGNICRCTGYQKIVDAIAAVSGTNR